MSAVNGAMRDHMAASLETQFAGVPVWLAVSKQEYAEATQADCLLCGALAGAILYPAATTLGTETLTEAVATHRHWKHVYAEVFRQPGHVDTYGGGLRFAPDEPVPFMVAEDGVYRITVYRRSDDAELMWTELGVMRAGCSIITTLWAGVRGG